VLVALAYRRLITAMSSGTPMRKNQPIDENISGGVSSVIIKFHRQPRLAICSENQMRAKGISNAKKTTSAEVVGVGFRTARMRRQAATSRLATFDTIPHFDITLTPQSISPTSDGAPGLDCCPA
jgi:hypothetical protein